MSNEKFTPGEWKIQPISESCAGVPALMVHEPEKYGEIAIINYHGYFHGEGSDGKTEKANAALIAAAPEMYRLLKRLIELTDYAELVGVLSDAKTTLKKARGE